MDTNINPEILTWARERLQLSIETLAERMKRTPDEIKMWEEGSKEPPYGCLEDLAYKHFGIPLALFFFPSPPDVPNPVKKFRRLSDFELTRFSDDTIKKIRLGQAYQDSLRVIVEHDMPKRIFKDIKPINKSIKDLAREVREYLGISLEDQYKYRSAETAFKSWRHAMQESGVFTFKDTFKDKFISGFCLFDENYPIIFLNNSNSFSRQVFSLIHELGHILFGVNGVSDVDDTYLAYMVSSERRVEIVCNQFASQLLVPDNDFNNSIELYKEKGINAISSIANQYSVSREVILRRLLDKGIVSEELYQEQSAEWSRDYLRIKKDKSRGNYYLTRLSYLGEGFTKAAFSQYRKGKLSRAELATHLNIKSKNVESFENRLRW